MTTIHKIFGPPGSGKTTYLLSLVEKELAAGTKPQRIGYFSFTKKAATEAKERALLRFPHLNPRTDFPFFRTLHSLAYLCLGVRREDMMGPKDYQEFAVKVGLELRIDGAEEDEPVIHADHPVLNEINLARIRGTDLRVHYNQCNLGVEWPMFEYMDRAYRAFRTERELLDFTDLLEQLLQYPQRVPSLDVVIIDEAQDLSRLQWGLVEELVKRCQRAHLAGDDDQAVFGWAGADVDSFLGLRGQVTVLHQSWRVPRAVYELADDIVRRIHHRQEKVWCPKDLPGVIQHHGSWQTVDVTEGQWLILASTNYLLNPVCAWLKAQGLFFERNGVPSIPQKIVHAVVDWERLRRGRVISGLAARNVYALLDARLIQRGQRELKGIDPIVEYAARDLVDQFGLLCDPACMPVWFDAMTRISDDRRAYMQAVLKRGARITATPRIRVSTIHSAKGGEADNVLLLMDLSPKFARDYFKQADDVHRLFYVGVTRTRNALHLVLPQKADEGFVL